MYTYSPSNDTSYVINCKCNVVMYTFNLTSDVLFANIVVTYACNYPYDDVLLVSNDLLY